MKITNDQITFDESDFDGLSDFARKAIEQRIGTVADFARETGTILSRSLDADKARLRSNIAASPEVQNLVEKLALTDDTSRADAIAAAVERVQ
jgi:hypothetical protein